MTLTPARAIPPHRILQRELDARQWSVEELSDRANLTQSVAIGLLGGTEIMSPKYAAALAKAFGTSTEFWVNLTASYERQKWMKMGGDRS